MMMVTLSLYPAMIWLHLIWCAAFLWSPSYCLPDPFHAPIRSDNSSSIHNTQRRMEEEQVSIIDESTNLTECLLGGGTTFESPVVLTFEASSDFPDGSDPLFLEIFLAQYLNAAQTQATQSCDEPGFRVFSNASFSTGEFIFDRLDVPQETALDSIQTASTTKAETAGGGGTKKEDGARRRTQQVEDSAAPSLSGAPSVSVSPSVSDPPSMTPTISSHPSIFPTFSEVGSGGGDTVHVLLFSTGVCDGCTNDLFLGNDVSGRRRLKEDSQEQAMSKRRHLDVSGDTSPPSKRSPLKLRGGSVVVDSTQQQQDDLSRKLQEEDSLPTSDDFTSVLASAFAGVGGGTLLEVIPVSFGPCAEDLKTFATSLSFEFEALVTTSLPDLVALEDTMGELYASIMLNRCDYPFSRQKLAFVVDSFGPVDMPAELPTGEDCATGSVLFRVTFAIQGSCRDCPDETDAFLVEPTGEEEAAPARSSRRPPWERRTPQDRLSRGGRRLQVDGTCYCRNDLGIPSAFEFLDQLDALALRTTLPFCGLAAAPETPRDEEMIDGVGGSGVGGGVVLAVDEVEVVDAAGTDGEADAGGGDGERVDEEVDSSIAIPIDETTATIVESADGIATPAVTAVPVAAATEPPVAVPVVTATPVATVTELPVAAPVASTATPVATVTELPVAAPVILPVASPVDTGSSKGGSSKGSVTTLPPVSSPVSSGSFMPSSSVPSLDPSLLNTASVNPSTMASGSGSTSGFPSNTGQPSGTSQPSSVGSSSPAVSSPVSSGSFMPSSSVPSLDPSLLNTASMNPSTMTTGSGSTSGFPSNTGQPSGTPQPSSVSSSSPAPSGANDTDAPSSAVSTTPLPSAVDQLSMLPSSQQPSSSTATQIPTTPPSGSSTSTSPSLSVIITPSPTTSPSEAVSPAPLGAATFAPSEAVTPVPSEAVTPAPSEAVTPAPSEAVTPVPSEAVTPVPSEAVTPAPTPV